MAENNNPKKGAVISTVSGGAAGAVAVLYGVSAGAASGTAGAAAMTSGLATLGGVIGGGMAAGIVVLAAAPLAGCALGYLGFRFYKKNSSPKK